MIDPVKTSATALSSTTTNARTSQRISPCAGDHALVYGAFFITMFARPSFGGSLYDRNGYLPFKPPFGPEKWRWDVNATALTVLVVILLAGLATI